MEIEKKCPFCEGTGKVFKIIKEALPGGYYHGESFYCVECSKCSARSKPIKIEFFCNLYDATVEDYRNNNALRAKHEDEYDKYIEGQKQEAIKMWNKRGHGV